MTKKSIAEASASRILLTSLPLIVTNSCPSASIPQTCYCSVWLQCVVAACCCSVWLQCVVATCCCSVLLQCVVAACCCSVWLQCVVAACCCSAWLQCVAVTCHVFHRYLANELAVNQRLDMGWLQSVGSIKFQVSFAEYRVFHRALVQNKHIISSILLTKATPYQQLPRS